MMSKVKRRQTTSEIESPEKKKSLKTYSRTGSQDDFAIPEIGEGVLAKTPKKPKQAKTRKERRSADVRIEEESITVGPLLRTDKSKALSRGDKILRPQGLNSADHISITSSQTSMNTNTDILHTASITMSGSQDHGAEDTGTVPVNIRTAEENGEGYRHPQVILTQGSTLSNGEADFALDILKNDLSFQESKVTTETTVESGSFGVSAADENGPPGSTEMRPPKLKTNRKVRNPTADELGSDDIGIGLPKENYQPRPSRSRSIKDLDAFVLEVDYSKRPETLTKSKNKRRKTTGDIVRPQTHLGVGEVIPEMSKDQTGAIPDAPGGESPNGLLYRRHETIEPTLALDGNRENADIPGPRKKRGRPKKQSSEYAEEDPLVDDNPSNDVPTVPLNDQKGAETAGTKRSRKRLKKDESPVPIIEERGMITGDKSNLINFGKTPETKPEETNNILEATDGNSLRAADDALQLQKEGTPSPSRATATAQTPNEPSSKGPDRHSPLNGGKVGYRVGLSKRARIEPLLRIVRK